MKKKDKITIVDILLSALFALKMSVLCFFISIIALFVFGLICGMIEPLGDLLDRFFNMLPFWNEKWDYAWVLYFSQINSVICEVIGTISILRADRNSTEQTDVSIEDEEPEKDSWDSMTLEEKEMWLRKYYPELYGNRSLSDDWAEYDARKKAEEERTRQFYKDYETKRLLSDIKDDLDHMTKY